MSYLFLPPFDEAILIRYVVCSVVTLLLRSDGEELTQHIMECVS